MFLSINLINLLNKTIYLLLIFLGGIFIGFIILLSSYLIISLIHKKIKNTPKVKDLPNIPITDPKKVIIKYHKIYDEEYSYKIIQNRISSIKTLSFGMIKDISTIYNPNANDPILEVSIENLLLLSNHIIDKVDNFANEIIESNAFKIFWAGFASFQNIKGFIKGIFKKEKEEVLSFDVRKLKLSYVLSMLDKTKNGKDKKEEKNEVEYKKYFILDNFINNKIKELLAAIADEIILVYSHNLPDGGIKQWF